MKYLENLSVRSDFAGDWVRLEDVESKLRDAVLKFGNHLGHCNVLMRWRNDDGTHCNCGYRDIVGGNDGEPE